MVMRWLGRRLEGISLVWWPSRHQSFQICSKGSSHVAGEASAAEDKEGDHLVPAGRLVLPGWHMLELAVSHERASLMVGLHLDIGSGLGQGQYIQLPLRHGRVAKRMFFVPTRLRGIRFDGALVKNGFTVTHLKIVWLTPWFAHDRLVRRLVSVHQRWRDQARGEVLATLKAEAFERGMHWRNLALEHYEATFERRSSRRNYVKWLETRRELSAAHVAKVLGMLPRQPKVSFLLPVGQVRIEWLRKCLDSVLGQLYGHWELCIAGEIAAASEVCELLEAYAARDARIKPLAGCGVDELSKVATGEFVAILGAHDLLSPHALFHVIEALHRHPDAGLLYGDEDRIDERGGRSDPHFKPQWNPDLLLAQNYIGRLAVYRTDLLHALDGVGVQIGEDWADHDLALRVSSRLAPAQIVHIPYLTYHRRTRPMSNVAPSAGSAVPAEAGLRSVRAQVQAHVPDAEVAMGAVPQTYRVRWPLPARRPLVSLLIPTRDRVEILKPCVDAILERTRYCNR